MEDKKEKEKLLQWHPAFFAGLQIELSEDAEYIIIAKQSLTHTDLKLDELADALGYRYSSYFITQFTKAVGMTPGEYREKHRITRDPHGTTL